MPTRWIITLSLLYIALSPIAMWYMQGGGLIDRCHFLHTPMISHYSAPRITSADINDHVVQAYKLLCDHLDPRPITYFAEIASMPTQETTWQFDAYFVRLYATSSLDSDGSAVGVFPGRYEDFRHHSSESSSDARDEFTRVEFTSPIRFLVHR